MQLTIVLPTFKASPIGGYRVHYEYANRLAARGHTVTISARVQSRRQHLEVRARGVQRSLRRMVSWFDFHPRVRFAILGDRPIPRCDVLIVTAWQTGELVPSLRSRARAVVHVAYDYEFWMHAGDAKREHMTRAFAHADVVVATSSAVASMVRATGREPAATITCGLDPDAFRVVRDPASRGPVVGFLARPDPIKRCADAVAAVTRVRVGRDLRVLAVGRGGIDLPEWVEVADAPDDDAMCAFYNELAVFLLPSEYEGWGLTAAEAMACGAAVVSTRNGGVEDFARDGENALLVPPCEPDALAAACSALLSDDAARARIARCGVETAREMSWDRSVDALEQVLQSVI